MDFDYEAHLSLALNCAVWDIQTGNVLKLGEGRVITHAIHGLKPLTGAQIRQAYGDPPVFEKLKWPATNKHMS